jgi:hypothetical protein
VAAPEMNFPGSKTAPDQSGLAHFRPMQTLKTDFFRESSLIMIRVAITISSSALRNQVLGKNLIKGNLREA